ncbi:MAG: DUF1801 domain-containing protein [Chloroflexota bacterium]
MAKPETVEQYIEILDAPRRDIATALRAAIQQGVPHARESIKWAQPVYEVNGPVCAIKAHARHVTLVFWRGQTLRDICSAIEGGGDKMGHLKFADTGSVDADLIGRLCTEAARLNQEQGNPATRAHKE